MNQLEALKSLLREACDHLQEERDEVFNSNQTGGTIKVSDQFSAAAAERVASIDDLIKRAGIAITALPEGDPTVAPPPNWKPNNKYEILPQTLGEWDWQQDAPENTPWLRSKKRLHTAACLADPRAPDQMALVLRIDVSRVIHRLTWLNARFGLEPAREVESDANEYRIVFDQFPGPTNPSFIEVEDASGKSINAGLWRARPDGKVELVIDGTTVRGGQELKDKARLDFLDECNRRLNARYQTTYGWAMVMNHNVNRLMAGRHLDVDLNDSKAHGHKSCRDAIDAEMQRVERARAATLQGPADA